MVVYADWKALQIQSIPWVGESEEGLLSIRPVQIISRHHKQVLIVAGPCRAHVLHNPLLIDLATRSIQGEHSQLAMIKLGVSSVHQAMPKIHQFLVHVGGQFTAGLCG